MSSKRKLPNIPLEGCHASWKVDLPATQSRSKFESVCVREHGESLLDRLLLTAFKHLSNDYMELKSCHVSQLLQDVSYLKNHQSISLGYMFVNNSTESVLAEQPT